MPVHAVDELHRLQRNIDVSSEAIEDLEDGLDEDQLEASNPSGDEGIETEDYGELEAERRYQLFLAADTPPIPIQIVEEDRIDPAWLPDSIDPFEATAMELLRSDIASALSGLTEIRRRVVILRFGLEDGHPRTLEEVGHEFNLTRERIRQIGTQALKSLRHPDFTTRLRGYNPRDLRWSSVLADIAQAHHRRWRDRRRKARKRSDRTAAYGSGNCR